MRSVWQAVSTRLFPRLATARPPAAGKPHPRHRTRSATGAATRSATRSAARVTAEAIEGRLLFAADPVINEFLALNNNGLVFEGEHADWIELYNPNAETVSLNGYYLTDDPTPAGKTKWQFPNMSMGPGTYLLVYAADPVRRDPAAPLSTGFKLDGNGEYLGLIRPDLTVASEYAPTFPEQTADVSYGLGAATPPSPAPLGYFNTPTPGRANGPITSQGVVDDTEFNIDRGFYDSPFNLEITTTTPDAQIRYTTDGSAPGPTTGTLYTGPININRTSTVRAIAFRPGYVSSNVDTQTYIFVNDVVTQSPTGQPPGAGWPAPGRVNNQVIDYGMDPDVVNSPLYSGEIRNSLKAIPTMSLVMNLNDLFSTSTGIYANPSRDERAWERAGSLEVMYPDGRLANYQANAGVRLRGGFSRSGDNPKHAFRFFFRDDYGDPKWQHPTFGPDAAQEFDKFDLRTFQNYSWSFGGDGRGIFVRDQFSRDAQLAMGSPAERGDYYHLYINGVYWGLYNSDERPEANYGASYFGGTQEDYDTIKVDPDLGHNIEATDGNMAAWTELYSLARNNLQPVDNALYQRLLGNNPDGARNPAYKVLVDPDNLIDYMLVIYYGGNLDAPISNFIGNTSPNNWYGLRNRNGNEGFRFFAHDSEHTLLDLNQNRTGPFPTPTPSNPTSDMPLLKSNPQWLLQRLMTNPTFRTLFADHVQKNMIDPGGTLTPTGASALLQRRRTEIFSAVVGESARWGDAKRSVPFTRNSEWTNEFNRVMNQYVPQRTAVVLNQFRTLGWFPTLNAPSFSQRGGTVPAGYNLFLNHSNGVGSIYYTLDGSDPRLPDNSAGGLPYSTPIPINGATRVRARVFNPASGAWSAVQDAAFTLDVTGLRITEVNYNPAPAAGGNFNNEDYEFVEVKNVGGTTLNLKDIKFTRGIEFTFPDQNLAPGELAVIVRNQAAFQSRYGTAARILGAYGASDANNFANTGERVTLMDAANQALLDFTFADGTATGWYPTTDGAGYTLTVVNQTAPASAYNNSTNWRPSRAVSGTPGFDETSTAPVITAATYLYQSSPHRLQFQFTHNVQGTLDASDVTLRNRVTGAAVPATLSYDAGTNTATFNFNTTLPNGDYRAHVRGAGISSGGVPMPLDFVFDFFYLAGDVTRDRSVNGTDFAVLAANFGKTGRTYADGDLNGDGAVNGSDYALLAGNFGRSLPAVPAGLLVTSAAASITDATLPVTPTPAATDAATPAVDPVDTPAPAPATTRRPAPAKSPATPAMAAPVARRPAPRPKPAPKPAPQSVARRPALRANAGARPDGLS